MRDCERCGQEVSWTNDTMTLFGCVQAHVCTSCSRDIELRFKATSLSEQMIVWEARAQHYDDLAIARSPVTEADRLALRRDKDALELELIEYAIAWLAQRVEATP